VETNYLIYAAIFFGAIVLIVLLLPTSDKKNMKTTASDKSIQPIKPFVLETTRGDIKFYDPFDSFLCYAGMNGGKTKSIGKPLLREYIKNQFAGFVYDYKDWDLTKTAHHLCKKYNYPYPFYYISFTDLSKSHRTNIIKPSVMQNETFFIQLITDFFDANRHDSKRDEWYSGALGIVKGIAIYFYYHYPELCTLPHIANYICNVHYKELVSVLKSFHESRTLASAFLQAETSPATLGSFLGSATNFLGTFAFNKDVTWVLTGDDFDYNLLDPTQPKLVAIANSYKIEQLINPVISMMFMISSRGFELNNKIPFFYMLDEFTTVPIAEFEKLPSTLREYLCSFCILTQSASKLQKLYGKEDRSSIEGNIGNQFFGKTKDIEALKTYSLIFGKEDKRRVSNTRGESKGGENRSRTVSLQLQERYDTNFFTKLKPGEFVGSAAHSNYTDFHLQFKQYKEKEDPLPILNTVLPTDVRNNYDQMKKDIYHLISHS